MSSYLLIFVILSALNALHGQQIGCQNENGELVDWFYAYKLPRGSKYKRNNAGSSGLNYAYVTSKSSTSDWILSQKLVNQSSSIMGQTLSATYGDVSDLLVLLYNDEPTNQKWDAQRGHTKGVVAANENGGFWLIHSVPKYPPSFEDTKYYDYPKTGTIYGQSFLCISLNQNEMKKVGKQLRINEPTIYAKNIPDKLKSVYPELVSASMMETIKEPPFYNIENIISRKGVNFTSFAKAGKFDKELYEDWVAPTLGDDLYVEGWRHGGGNIDSDCSKHTRVYNIQDISLKEYQIDFKTMSDHSKWQVSSPNKNWICVGDINRQEHQKVRGGGTVCQYSQPISQLYRKTIKDMEPCKKQSFKIEIDIELNENF